MSKLKIIDADAFGKDPLRQLYSFEESINRLIDLDSFTVTQENNTIASDGVTLILKSKIELTSNGLLTPERLDEIAQTLNGLNVLTHKTEVEVPDGDMDVNTFNYNNYATDAFSFYNLRNIEYEDYTIQNSERNLPNFCLGAARTRLSAYPEEENYYTMFGAIPVLTHADMLAKGRDVNVYEFDDEFLEYGEAAEQKFDYFKSMLANDTNQSRADYNLANSHVYVDFDYRPADSQQIGNVPFFNRIRLPVKDIPLVNPHTGEEVGTTNINTQSSLVRAFSQSGLSNELIKSFRHANSSMRNFRINRQPKQLKVYDLFEFFEEIGFRNELADFDEMYLRSKGLEYGVDSNSPFVFYFRKLLLLGKLRGIIKPKLLNFRELILEGENHKKEHVGFKVIKRTLNRQTPVQTFYFLNRVELEDFIDTQIKFDRVYTYEIIAMYAVFGSDYFYSNITLGVNNNQRQFLSFQFTNKPSVKIVEVPFGSHTLRVVEPPPIIPEITFYNEMTSKNKVKIRLEHQDGNLVDEYHKKPMRQFAGNEAYIDKLKQYFSSDDVLVTSGKTSDGTYEIYRLEEPPQSHRDFEGALLATVQSSTVFMNGERAKSVIYTDFIKHQKKYYYAFRTITHRGNPSELSPVYVVEMYEDADQTFLTFDLYQSPEIRNYQNNYSMRKYIQILPNFSQTLTNDVELVNNYPSAEAALDHLKMGMDILEEKAWDYKDPDRYLKLRLESKNSGRKIDLNVYFKIKKPND